MFKADLSTWTLSVYLGMVITGLSMTSSMAVSAAAANIYDESAKPRVDIQKALVVASKEHKRVIVDFGGNWCGDCQVLDVYFHDPQNLPTLQSNFVLVHVNICKIDCNIDIAKQYGVDLKKGVPALAVLNAQGKQSLAKRMVSSNRCGPCKSRLSRSF